MEPIVVLIAILPLVIIEKWMRFQRLNKYALKWNLQTELNINWRSYFKVGSYIEGIKVNIQQFVLYFSSMLRTPWGAIYMGAFC